VPICVMQTCIGFRVCVMQTCKVSCCGLMNYQQHCNSKRHLRKTAAVGAALLSEAGSPNTGDEADSSPSLNPTYVGLQAQCRNYCKQVSADCAALQPFCMMIFTVCREPEVTRKTCFSVSGVQPWVPPELDLRPL